MLEVKNISKSFPGVNALSNVSFTVRRGSVHVLCGENGAGKSTIMKILNGLYQPDQGSILYNENELILKSASDAKKHGIGMIFQELNYIPEITIAEYMFLGEWPINKFYNVNWKLIYTLTNTLLKKENFSYNPNTKLKDLSISDIQILEILKVISSNVKLIIMDEPTSAITNKEVKWLFEKIELLKSEGKSIIYVSHKMEEIFKIADDISILRDGYLVSTGNKKDFTIDSVITNMVGRKIANDYPKNTVKLGEYMLEVENFSSDLFHDVNFNIRKGEIVGFAGLMGAGRTEIVRAIYGLDKYNTGKIIINNRTVKIKNVPDAIKNGIVMLSEDRRRYGLVQIRSVKENITLASLTKFIYHFYLHQQFESNEVQKISTNINIKTSNLDTTVDTLSGGNQQKVVLAKWIMREANIFLMDEPTRGIDVGAKYEIYKLMQNFVEEGKSILMISSELPELLGMCDRIYVLHNGTIVGELSRKDMDSEKIMRFATGTKLDSK